MEKRSFVVSIPTPKVKESVEIRENNFPKEFKEALHNYSIAYDDWCDAEGMMVFLYCLASLSVYYVIDCFCIAFDTLNLLVRHFLTF